jgi:hypothetical protein
MVLRTGTHWVVLMVGLMHFGSAGLDGCCEWRSLYFREGDPDGNLLGCADGFYLGYQRAVRTVLGWAFLMER